MDGISRAMTRNKTIKDPETLAQWICYEYLLVLCSLDLVNMRDHKSVVGIWRKMGDKFKHGTSKNGRD